MSGIFQQVTILALLSGLGSSATLLGQPPPVLPEGRGRAEFQRICGNCHGVQTALQSRLSEDRWAGVVDDMVSRGANGTQDEFDRIVRYLTTNFSPLPKVAVNNVSAKDLAAALSWSAEAAEAIVKFRETNGKYKDLRDLEKVPGIDLKQLREQKDRFDFSTN